MRRDFYLFSAFWFMVALLAFIQDYLNAQWTGSFFAASEAAAYTFFWLLFIPLTIWFRRIFNSLIKIQPGQQSNAKNLVLLVLFPIVFSLVHLLIFSLCLSGVSQLIHENPWKISWLIQEKLSTRLYISISVYAVFTYMAYRSFKKGQDDHGKEYQSFLPVKNGKKSTMVDINSIKWIKSDGAYVELHTVDRKHVIVNSLKNLSLQLNPDQFRRIHKSTIVNLRMVVEFRSRLNGDYDVIMQDGSILRLSRNYAGSLKGTML